MHRNLYVAGTRTDLADTSCRACDATESMLHLAECPVIREEFWDLILSLMEKMGMRTPVSDKRTVFILLGTHEIDGEVVTVKPEQSGLLFIAWRCLYAAIVGSRVDDRPLNLEYAYYRTVQMTITRVKAYGEKWKLWCIKNRNTGLKCLIPLDKRDRTVLYQDLLGDYTISDALLKEFERVKKAREQAPPAPRPHLRGNTRRTRQPLAPATPRPTRPVLEHEPVRPLGNTTQLTLHQMFAQHTQ